MVMSSKTDLAWPDLNTTLFQDIEFWWSYLGRLIKHARQCGDKKPWDDDAAVELTLWDDDDDNSWPTNIQEAKEKKEEERREREEEKRKEKEDVMVSNTKARCGQLHSTCLISRLNSSQVEAMLSLTNAFLINKRK